MAFGLSFGMNKSKSKSSSTTAIDKTETGSEATNGVKSSSGTTTNTGSSSTQTNQNTNQNTNNNTTGTQQSTQTTTNFSDSVLGGLESAVSQLLGGGNPVLSSNFNKDQFVADGVAAAQNRVDSDLSSSLNSMYDSFGGRDDQNSMATLLANRARGDAAAQVAGVRGQLTGQAEEIARGNYMANAGTQQNYLNSVLDALKGGRQSTTGNVATSESQVGQQTGSTTGSQTQQTQEQQVQQLQELINQLVNSTNHTVGTEKTDSKTKGTNIGGGASASF